MFTIALSQETENRFRLLAGESGKDIEEFVKEAVEKYLETLEEEENQLDAELARKALAEYERNPGPMFTVEDAMVRYGLSQEELMS